MATKIYLNYTFENVPTLIPVMCSNNHSIEPTYRYVYLDQEWDYIVEITADILVEYLTKTFKKPVDKETVEMLLKCKWWEEYYMEDDIDFIDFLKEKYESEAYRECCKEYGE